MREKENFMIQEKAIKIHEKILAIRKLNPYLKRVNLNTPQFVFTLGNKSLTLELAYIKYTDYDTVVVTDTAIEYHPERGPLEEIVEYDGWDELLNL